MIAQIKLMKLGANTYNLPWIFYQMSIQRQSKFKCSNCNQESYSCPIGIFIARDTTSYAVQYIDVQVQVWRIGQFVEYYNYNFCYCYGKKHSHGRKSANQIITMIDHYLDL